MKKALLPILLLCAVVVFIVFSCKKTNNSTGPAQSLNQLFSGLRYTPQGLSVTAGRDTIVYGTNGTMLHFYTNSFKNASGNIITSGTVYLQLVEMYKPGDMICNRTTTMANGQILASGGEITINATMNGQTVYANKYGVGFIQTGTSTAPMALFYGTTGNSDSITTWTQSDTTQTGTIANGTTRDSSVAHGSGTNNNFYLFASCSNLNSVNCDFFYYIDSGTTSMATVSVILPDATFNPTNTQLYLIIPNINLTNWSGSNTFTAVLSTTDNNLGTGYIAATNTFNLISEDQTAIVPVGLNYKLVVITNKNGSYYYYEQAGVIPNSGGLNASAAMSPETQSDIVARLQGL